MAHEMGRAQTRENAPDGLLKDCHDIVNVLAEAEANLIEVVGPQEDACNIGQQGSDALIAMLDTALYNIRQRAGNINSLVERVKALLY